jgi:tRNA threonylcarbamoyladenosine biosynthesis protein TsaB
LSAVKALAVALMKPIAAVSVLQAVAAASPQPGRVLAALDDNRGHIYTGDYYVHGTDLPVAREEALLTLDEFVGRAAEATVVCPDQRLAQALAGRGIRVHEIARPDADLIARLGYTKLLAGETATPETLDANYIRRSDAELFAKPGF